MKYKMSIRPALDVEARHILESMLKEIGYSVIGGGTCVDMSSCDISFEVIEEAEKEQKPETL
jgi:hypothetical protein